MEAFLIFGLLLLFIAMSVPIGIAIGLSTAISMALTTKLPLILIAQKSFTGLDSFPLLAIPFFMLAGSLMCNGGIAKRLVHLADSLVGFIIGGLGMVTILACMFFAAISGSGPATVSAIGSFMIPAMRERKYHGDFAAALTTAAGTIGVLIPPSIPFVIYSVVAQTSIGDMFIAGIIPGVMIGLALMILCYFMARKRGYPVSMEKPSAKRIALSFKDAFGALMVPVIILGGIYGGIFTPTEAAVVASVYSFFVGKYLYKELNWDNVYKSLKEAALINGATMFLIGLSMAFSNYLALARIPNMIADGMMTISENPFIIMILLNIFLLIVGLFIENIVAIIILTPILLPVVTSIGIDPIHFGVIQTVNFAIGFMTPPYGINLFVASAISRESIEDISRAIVPFILVMLLCLMLITYIPSLSMGLVDLIRR